MGPFRSKSTRGYPLQSVIGTEGSPPGKRVSWTHGDHIVTEFGQLEQHPFAHLGEHVWE